MSKTWRRDMTEIREGWDIDAKLMHRVELSPSLFPDTLPRIPQSFKKEVKAIFETMSG